MIKELAVRETGEIVVELTPEQVVETATAQAKLLMNIVEQTKCYQEISGKKYLQVEAWETIGAFNRTHAETENISPILREGETIGYQAHVQLWKDGIVVGGAIMPCYFTENCCKGKEGDAKHKSCMSAAQTFATSKAYRMNYSYVAILAGYQPLPAEEVTEDMKQPETDKKEHYCKLHGVNFFMKGKMKSYAHPIKDENGKDTGEWCHEHKAKEKPESEQDTRGEFEKEGTDILEKALVETEQLKSASEPTSPAKEERRVNNEELLKLGDMIKQTGVTLTQLGKYMKVDKKWEVSKLGDLKKWQFEEIMGAFSKGQEKPPKDKLL